MATAIGAYAVSNVIGSVLGSLKETADGILNNATNGAASAATRALVEASQQALTMIKQAKDAYEDSMQKTVEEVGDLAIKVFADLDRLVGEIQTRNDANLKAWLEESEALIRLLPFTGTQLYVSGYSPHFFVPKPDDVNATIPLKFRGNYPYSNSYSFTAKLFIGGQELTPANASDKELEFWVKPALLRRVIFDATAEPALQVQLQVQGSGATTQVLEKCQRHALDVAIFAGLQIKAKLRNTEKDSATLIDASSLKALGTQDGFYSLPGKLVITHRSHIWNMSTTVEYPVGLTALPEFGGDLVVQTRSTTTERQFRDSVKSGLYFAAAKGSGTVLRADVTVPDTGWYIVSSDPGKPGLDVKATIGGSNAWFSTIPQQMVLFVELYASKGDVGALVDIHYRQYRDAVSGKVETQPPKRIEWDQPIILEPFANSEFATLIYNSSDGGRREYAPPFVSDKWLQFQPAANGAIRVIADPSRNQASTS